MGITEDTDRLRAKYTLSNSGPIAEIGRPVVGTMRRIMFDKPITVRDGEIIVIETDGTVRVEKTND